MGDFSYLEVEIEIFKLEFSFVQSEAEEQTRILIQQLI